MTSVVTNGGHIRHGNLATIRILLGVTFFCHSGAVLASDSQIISEDCTATAGLHGAEAAVVTTLLPGKDKMSSVNFCSTEEVSEVLPVICTSDSETVCQGGVGFVSPDSCEPDSIESNNEPLKVGHRIQRRLDSMLSELGKGVDYLSDFESYFSTVIHYTNRDDLDEWEPLSSRTHSSVQMELTPQNRRTVQRRKSLTDGDTEKLNCFTSTGEKKRKCEEDHQVTSPVGACSGPYADVYKADQSNSSEMVVRPKVRKEKPYDGRKLSSTDFTRSTNTGNNSVELSEPLQSATEYTSNSTEVKNDIGKFLSFEDSETVHVDKKEERRKTKCLAWLEERCSPADDNRFWAEFVDYNRNSPNSIKDNDSSECSDGEWSAIWTSGFAEETQYSSSDESWETLPGRDEPEPESRSSDSSLEENASELCFPIGEHTALEEGEIPWLSYHDECTNDSSSDEESDAVSHLVHPAFFMLDNNNNLEDDSSISEDLDGLLDEFATGLGAAQALSYMGPQFLTYMAVEERLAQVMEAAMAHLETLNIDAEQAHPPATKESIDCLPQFSVTDDHSVVGQDQCCAICCSEYIRDEIVTELPCHHLFHKPCVTLWLQKSGTCPVCRHILVPALPEGASATSFLPDHDMPPSVHSTAGTR
ncbi:E3 ubiquitin-protein ligase Praja-2 isoform X3 [Protopterus annectens]|uniref:E3 ubiquitin-protein ligase Praja-2 isoform X3 n=1 Tax=Protopterus annectens TaxID=7888 RepID=UPI001CFBC5F7|nr:E3 ubiquitin-protein ligase Praja-2 isoform X3 [Protopterus annectens]